jgi:uncharacterized protein (TIGR02452 family)
MSIKNKIEDLVKISIKINNNEQGYLIQHNQLVQQTKDLLDKKYINITKERKIEIIKENKQKYGEKDTDYKDSNGIYKGEVQYTGSINTENNFRTKTTPQIINITFMINTANNAMKHYTSQGYIVNLLNFANANFCGGGVEDGASAQEEELCRTSPMLYNSLQLFSMKRDLLKSNRYKYHGKLGWGSANWNKRILFTPKVIFRREDATYNYDELVNPYDVNIITAAAPDFGKPFGPSFDKNDSNLKNNLQRVIKHIYFAPDNSLYHVKNKTKTIFWKGFDGNRIVEKLPTESIFPTQKRVLLLGPWGCGAFVPQNNPSEYRRFMAEQFSIVLKNIENRYDEICFTFLSDTDDNFIQFKSVLENSFTLKYV